ncbi:MAG: FxLYD domain-containing protein [Terriglobales bacterium]
MPNEQVANRVSVTDMNMPFLSMVRFMVKWAIASIPALLILMILGAISWGVLFGFFAGLGSSISHKPSEKSSSIIPDTSIPGPTPSSVSSDPAIAAYLTKVTVQKVQVSKSSLGDNAVFGEVKNTGDRTLKEVEVTIYCLDSGGKTIFEKPAFPVLVSDLGFGSNNQPLRPGYSRQFGVKLDDVPSEWSKKVDVKVTSVKPE